MDFTPTEEQDAVRELARQVMAGRGPADQDSGYPRPWPDTDTWEALAGAGLLGLCVPEAHGGGGQAVTELSLLLTELGRAAARVPAWPTLAVAVPALARHADPEIAARFLPGIAAGTTSVGCALTEPNAVDPRAPRLRAAIAGDGLRLEGVKCADAAVDDVDALIVSGRAEDGHPVAALVAPDADGLTRTSAVSTDGTPVEVLSFDGVAVDADHVIGRDPGVLADLIDHAQIGRAALALGVAEQALAMTAAHVTQRHQFGRPIGTFQAVACRVADAYIDTQSMRATLAQATWRMDEGLDAREEVAVAAFWAADGVRRVLASSVHLHGGLGVDVDYPLHHYFLQAKRLELLLGSSTATLVDLGEVLAAAP